MCQGFTASSQSLFSLGNRWRPYPAYRIPCRHGLFGPSAFGTAWGTATITTTEYYYGQQVASFGGAPALITAGCTGSSIPCTGSLYYSTPAMPVAGSTLNVAVSGISIPNGAKQAARELTFIDRRQDEPGQG
jgi:hypothetical protein